MNIEKDLERQILELNRKLTEASIRGDVNMSRNLTRQIVLHENALEAARNLKPIEPPVSMGQKPKPKPRRISPAGKFEQSLQAQMDEAAKRVSYLSGPPMGSHTIKSSGWGQITEVRDEPNGDISIISKDSNGQIIEMSRIANFNVTRPTPKPRKPEPLEIEAKIALTTSGMIRCSREAVLQNPCGSVFCAHRADWLCKTESVGTWSQFLKDPKIDTVTKEVHLPICFGLARAKCFIQVRRVGEDNAEGWAEYTLSHALEGGDIVVSMLLEPRKGDSLAHGMRAIEAFYRMQPEHDETKLLEQLICAERGMHPPWYDDDFKSTIYNLPGMNNQTPIKVIEDLFCTSNSFARLNSPGYAMRGESGLCIACYRKKWMMT